MAERPGEGSPIIGGAQPCTKHEQNRSFPGYSPERQPCTWLQTLSKPNRKALTALSSGISMTTVFHAYGLPQVAWVRAMRGFLRKGMRRPCRHTQARITDGKGFTYLPSPVAIGLCLYCVRQTQDQREHKYLNTHGMNRWTLRASGLLLGGVRHDDTHRARSVQFICRPCKRALPCA